MIGSALIKGDLSFFSGSQLISQLCITYNEINKAKIELEEELLELEA